MPTPTFDSFTYIGEQKDLDILIKQLYQSLFFALDVEFIRDRTTYWPQIALIQINMDEKIYIIDPLFVDIKALGYIFKNPKILKVGHCVSQDIFTLKGIYGGGFCSFFDTQLAFQLLGLGPDAGLSRLTETFFDISIDKREQHRNWLERPLNDYALNYALYDVKYLLKLFHLLKEMLCKKDLEQVFTKRMEGLIAQIKTGSDKRWKRLKPKGYFGKKKMEFLYKIFNIREEIGIQLNIYPEKIYPNTLLRNLILSNSLKSESFDEECRSLFLTTMKEHICQ